tara:strand:+ start:359 stop:592 length:234 start_codon:yes stop_codon:yes gene_type:complete
MARNAPAEISEEASPSDVDVNALPLAGWPGFKERFLSCFWELEGTFTVFPKSLLLFAHTRLTLSFIHRKNTWRICSG